MLTACEADYRGRTGYADRHYPQGEILRRLLAAVAAVDVGAVARAAREPRLIPEHIRAARVAALKTAMRNASETPTD